jgi:hypothetical protein
MMFHGRPLDTGVLANITSETHEHPQRSERGDGDRVMIHVLWRVNLVATRSQGGELVLVHTEMMVFLEMGCNLLPCETGETLYMRFRCGVGTNKYLCLWMKVDVNAPQPPDFWEAAYTYSANTFRQLPEHHKENPPRRSFATAPTTLERVAGVG